MTIIRSKIFMFVLAGLFTVGFSTSAASIIGVPALASVVRYLGNGEPDQPVEENPLFAAYPDVLQEHRSKSKDYVKAFCEKKRDYVIHFLNKGEKFFPRAIAILEKYNVPLEIRMVPILESEFNANAVSPVGAVGYWQFMSTLAKEYGLKIGGKYDERKNFTKSTTAAAKYFRDQLKYFNDDLLLAVASYNCGAGRVRASIKKTGKTDANFWDIKRFLPAETRKFVMNFIALNVISENYDMFVANNFDLDEEPVLEFAFLDSTTFSNDVVDVKPVSSVKARPDEWIKPAASLH